MQKTAAHVVMFYNAGLLNYSAANRC